MSLWIAVGVLPGQREEDEEGYNYLLERFYKPFKRPFRGCQPRDILQQLDEVAYFLQRPPRLDKELIDLACRSYFVQS